MIDFTLRPGANSPLKWVNKCWTSDATHLETFRKEENHDLFLNSSVELNFISLLCGTNLEHEMKAYDAD